MTLTIEEKNLIALCRCRSRAETALMLREVLPDITAPEERTAALGAIRKLEAMSGAEFSALLEWETGYAG
ncbi:MAG: transposon-transfer assisting family protein [Gracilibacteraceae bacterium]|jgi:hypothetical protein|nr:transposon-transfer assisting family protein [Gracilibacteraceae bacterium]